MDKLPQRHVRAIPGSSEVGILFPDLDLNMPRWTTSLNVVIVNSYYCSLADNCRLCKAMPWYAIGVDLTDTRVRFPFT